MKDIVIALIISATLIVLTYVVVIKAKGNIYVEINGKPPRIVIKKKKQLKTSFNCFTLYHIRINKSLFTLN